jgi:hypothetical protein
VSGGRSPDCGLEGEGRQVVALVDDDETVGGEERFQVFDRLEALDHRQVDDAGQLASAAASLPDLLRVETEEGFELRAPLVEQRLAVGEDQRRQLPFRDQRARHHRLAAAGRCDEHTALVGEHGFERRLLERRQFCVELEWQPVRLSSPVLDQEPAAGSRDRVLDLAEQAAGQVQVG